MTESAVSLQPAFVLHSARFRESSVIVDMLTEDAGRVTLVAKGAKTGKQRWAALLQPFRALHIAYSGRSELKTVTHCEAAGLPLPLQGTALYCGFYVNELVQKLFYRHDPHPQLFSTYRRCLESLATPDRGCLERALRAFEMQLLQYAGYGLCLDYAYDTGAAVAAQKRYGFHAERGVYEDRDGLFSGETLLAAQRNDYDAADLGQLKALMRIAIDRHINAPLKSRAFIAKICR